MLKPVGIVRVKLSSEASGFAYIGLSGGTTANSGGMLLSGGSFSGLLDGMELAPGQFYDIPRIGTGASGSFTVFARFSPACSGLARLYFEVF